MGQGLEKNTLTIGSGETYEWLIDFGTATHVGTRHYPMALADSQTARAYRGTARVNTDYKLPAVLPAMPYATWVAGHTSRS